MKVVKNIETVEITVNKDELLHDKWLSFQLLSKKLNEMEKQSNMCYKHLRNRLYNSRACNKYNTETIAGVLYIDTENPMKTLTSSLVIKFKKA